MCYSSALFRGYCTSLGRISRARRMGGIISSTRNFWPNTQQEAVRRQEVRIIIILCCQGDKLHKRNVQNRNKHRRIFRDLKQRNRRRRRWNHSNYIYFCLADINQPQDITKDRETDKGKSGRQAGRQTGRRGKYIYSQPAEE